MSGHSKWATIKRQKNANDAKKGKIFTKLAREIEVSARLHGGDPEHNARLRDSILEARSQNMPKNNIERAIKRGTGQLEGVQYEQVLYEGYGPGGVAILIECLTNNRNRTVSDVRSVLSRHGGSLGESGSVAWIFERKSILTVRKEAFSEEGLLELVLEVGAEDLQEEKEGWMVTAPLSCVEVVKKKIESVQKDVILSVNHMWMPKNTVPVEGDKAKKVLNLLEKLEDLDDVQKVSANFEIEQTQMEQMLS